MPAKPAAERRKRGREREGERKGERERGKEGEWESGIEGERERGREGERGRGRERESRYRDTGPKLTCVNSTILPYCMHRQNSHVHTVCNTYKFTLCNTPPYVL